MAVSSPQIPDSHGILPEDPVPVPEPQHPNSSPSVGAGILVAGIAVIALLLTVLADLPGLVRIVGILAGIWLAFQGVDRICRGIWGPAFDTTFALCSVWLVAVSLSALLAGVLPLREHEDVAVAIREPTNQSPDLFSSHPLGTNGLGLDLLARSIYGARVSMLTVGLTVAVTVIVGGLIGLAAGYYRGRIDAIVSVVTDTLLAIPALVLLIALATVLGRPTEVTEAVFKMSLGLIIVGLPTMVRLARANTMAFAQREFVLAARGMGATHRRIVLRELVPNVAVPLLSYAAIVAALFILAEGSLSFLGLGLAQPEPTWGNMIAEGQDARTLRDHPHIALVPGAFMFLTIFSFNRVGEYFRGASRD